jgi:cytochrome c oxidase subunit 4
MAQETQAKHDTRAKAAPGANDGGHASAAAHEHVEISHDMHEEHGLAHSTPVQLLVVILSILLILTIITVAVTKVDLGGQWNLVVAMVIATIKAGLVVTYFMHLRWDRRLHLLAFCAAILFMVLFISMALTDRREYQSAIDQLRDKNAQQTPQ